MRTIWLTLFFSLGAVAIGAAQDPAATSAPSTSTQDAQPADGLVSEPHILSRAIDFAERLMSETGTSRKDGFYADTDIITGAGWISGGPGNTASRRQDEVFTSWSSWSS